MAGIVDHRNMQKLCIAALPGVRAADTIHKHKHTQISTVLAGIRCIAGQSIQSNVHHMCTLVSVCVSYMHVHVPISHVHSAAADSFTIIIRRTCGNGVDILIYTCILYVPHHTIPHTVYKYMI